MAERHEFRFVIDGVELSDAQRARISGEIQKAGLAALQNVNAVLSKPVTVGHGNLELRPEWYGLWVVDGPLAEQLGARINDLGFWMPK